MEKGGWVRFKEWCFWSRGCERKIWMIDSADSSMPTLRLESWKKHGELNGWFFEEKKQKRDLKGREKKTFFKWTQKIQKKKQWSLQSSMVNCVFQIHINSLQTTDSAFFWRTWGTWQVQPIQKSTKSSWSWRQGNIFSKKQRPFPKLKLLKKLSKTSQIFVCFPPFLWG